MKKTMSAVLASLMLLGLVACGRQSQTTGNTASKDKAETSQEEGNEDITIKQLPWEVTEGVDGGNRRVMVEYTNGTAYDITDFQIDYAWKKDVTDEQLVQAYTEIDSSVTADTLRQTQPYCQVRSHVKAGSKASGTCDIGMYYLKGKGQLDIAEPDMLTVEYIDAKANALAKVYYDFASKKMNKDSSTTPLSKWPDSSPRAAMLPKPSTKLLTDLSDSDGQLMFTMIGVTQEDFRKYSDECVAQGWQVETSMDNLTYFNAKDGFTLDLMFDADASTLNVYLNKAD